MASRKAQAEIAAVAAQPVEMPAVEAVVAEVQAQPEPQPAPRRRGATWTPEQRAALAQKMKAKYDTSTPEGAAEVEKRKAEADLYWNSPEGQEKRAHFRTLFKNRAELAKAIEAEQTK